MSYEGKPISKLHLLKDGRIYVG